MSENAIEELEEIYRYVSYHLLEPKIAYKLKRKIENDILRLETNPHSCIEIHIGFRKRNFRRLVSGNYIIIYKVNELKQIVEIYHIYYKSRNYLNYI